MNEQTSEDLFEDTRMSFGDHLEELRKTLLRCLIGVALGSIVGFMVADKVVTFLQTPLVAAIKKYKDQEALLKYTDKQGFYPPEIQTSMERDGLAPQNAFVDRGQLIEAIRSINPKLIDELELTPYRFDSRHLALDKVLGVAQVLADPTNAHEENFGPVSALHALLTEAEKSELTQFAAQESATPETQTAVLKIVNRLIDLRAIHKHESFQFFLSEPDWKLSHLIVPPPENILIKMKNQVDIQSKNEELSRRLNRVLLSRVFAEQLDAPTIDLVPLDSWSRFDQGTQALSPHEVFVVWIKAAILTGLTLAGPWVFFQIWLFVAAGLYPHERKYVYYYLPISIILFVCGVCLAFFFVFAPVLQFLFSFNASMGITPQLRIGEWLSFVMFLPLGFGIAFQLPLVMLFAYRAGLVSIEFYLANWRIAIMIISVLSMLLTPADPISMVMLGGPLTILYFFGIGLCKWMPRNENPFRDSVAEVE